MKKLSSAKSSRLILILLFGILLGITLSSIFFYPNKIVSIWHSAKLKTKEIYPNSKELYEHHLADKLFEDVRVLCFVLTMPENHKTKAIHLKKTWGKRCNKLLFMSTINDPLIESIALPVQAGRDTLWDKTRTSFHYIFNHHFNDADWFIKADDDSYYFMENVRYMLAQYNSKTALYFGHRYAAQSSESGYMAGGGYILSKKALEKFVTRLTKNSTLCNTADNGAEDYEVGKCLDHHALFVDERDEMMQKRFFPVGIYEHLNKRNPNNTYWYDEMLFYESMYDGPHCCSDVIVNNHYVIPQEMYAYEYLIYNVHPFGIEKNLTEVYPKKIPFKEVIKASDLDSNATDYNKNNNHYHNFDEDEKYRRK